jgi:hypothetical protein
MRRSFIWVFLIRWMKILEPDLELVMRESVISHKTIWVSGSDGAGVSYGYQEVYTCENGSFF